MVTESFTTNPWCLQKRVLPQHTDHAGVMWHGAYVAWLEEARVEALAAAGIPYDRVSEQGYEMPVVRMQIQYRQALSHGDLVVLKSFALPRRGVRWPWVSRFCLQDGSCAAEAEVELVLVQFAEGKRAVARDIPAPLAEALSALLEGPVARMR